LDGRLGAIVGHGLDEREAAGAAGVAVERDAHAAHLDPLPGERFAELLLVDVVRKISDKKASTHRSSLHPCVLPGPRAADRQRSATRRGGSPCPAAPSPP